MVNCLSQLMSGFPAIAISGLTLDSRQVKPGDVFFAVTGTKLQANTFIKDAINQGAVAIISDTPFTESLSVPFVHFPDLKHSIAKIAAAFYGYPAKHLTISGVTGTNGKTSCTHFIASILKQLGQECGVIGTLGMGLWGNIKGAGLTTPDPITLQKTFAEWVKQGVRQVTMEVSSHSIHQNRIADIPFNAGIFTNLTRDHLDYHGTMDAYGATKKSWFLNSTISYAIINCDDDFGQKILADIPNKNTIYGYSQVESTQTSFPLVQATKVYCDKNGLHAYIHSPWGEGELHSRLMGRFNISNLLATITALCVQKIPFQSILTSIQHLSPVPGRMQAFGGGELPLVVIDYSHTPDSLEKALQALREHCKGKLYCVFGCGGDRDKGKRPLMAALAERYADVVIVTDDNPRFEDPSQITEDIFKGFNSLKKVSLEHDRSRAISNIINIADSKDCILIAGKGAETYQIIGDKKLPFSDVEEVSKGLNERLKSR